MKFAGSPITVKLTTVGGLNNENALSIFVDNLSKMVAVIPLISADQFDWAQTVIPEWKEYSGYEDWRETCEGFQIGLAMAGVDVKMIPISLGSFLSWCRDTKTPPSERVLETFAARSYDLRQTPYRVRATVGESPRSKQIFDC
jgi:hypothetical protein